jgi:lipopolysaccharide biosynthesis glycosyltransferase
MSDTISVVMAADENYAMQLAVTLASIATAPDATTCSAYVLHDGIPSGVRHKVEASCRGVIDVEWISLDPGAFDSVGTDARLPTSTLYRLLMPDALPPNVDRIVYLDCDLIVHHDLRPLWETALDGSPCAAVRDARIVSIGAPDGPPWRALGLDPHEPYFNAGVMLADLGAWRSEGIGARTLELMRAHAVPQNDQGALNAILSGRWKRLAPRWNLQGSHFVGRNNLAWTVEPIDELDTAYEDPAIVHFSGLNKPWNPRFEHPRRDDWFAALQQTPWAGWTPPRAIVRRTVGRARRAVDTAFGR